jgi:hypothetical protein
MRWVAKATPRLLYPREWPGAHFIGVWLCSRARRYAENVATRIRCPHRPPRSESLYFDKTWTLSFSLFSSRLTWIPATNKTFFYLCSPNERTLPAWTSSWRGSSICSPCWFTLAFWGRVLKLSINFEKSFRVPMGMLNSKIRSWSHS